PPPTTTASREGIALQPRPDQILEGVDEERRRVQRFGPPQRRRELARGLRRLDVDVEEDFRVVADEADRHDQELARSGGSIVDQPAELGTDPRLERAPRALIGD